MTDPADLPSDAHLPSVRDQFVHDLNHCLYVIGMGTELLRGARNDDARFEEICEAMEKERHRAVELIAEHSCVPVPDLTSAPVTRTLPAG